MTEIFEQKVEPIEDINYLFKNIENTFYKNLRIFQKENVKTLLSLRNLNINTDLEKIKINFFKFDENSEQQYMLIRQILEKFEKYSKEKNMFLKSKFFSPIRKLRSEPKTNLEKEAEKLLKDIFSNSEELWEEYLKQYSISSNFLSKYKRDMIRTNFKNWDFNDFLQKLGDIKQQQQRKKFKKIIENINFKLENLKQLLGEFTNSKLNTINFFKKLTYLFSSLSLISFIGITYFNLETSTISELSSDLGYTVLPLSVFSIITLFIHRNTEFKLSDEQRSSMMKLYSFVKGVEEMK
jgi:hypothetical protein